MRINRTLLDDLEKIYYSLMCETYENENCRYCIYCKNKKLCDTVHELLCSIVKFY